MNIFFLLLYSIGMVFGQVLFKKVSDNISNKSGLLDISKSLALDPTFYLAVGLYGLLSIYWIWLLSKISISYAYPFVALSIAAVVIIGWVVWNEKFSYPHFLGVLFVLVGVILIGVNGEQ